MSNQKSWPIAHAWSQRTTALGTYAIPVVLGASSLGDELTPRQLDTLRAYVGWYRCVGRAPTDADLLESLDLRSSNAISLHKRALNEKGAIEPTSGREFLVTVPGLLAALDEPRVENAPQTLDEWLRDWVWIEVESWNRMVLGLVTAERSLLVGRNIVRAHATATQIRLADDQRRSLRAAETIAADRGLDLTPPQLVIA